MAIFDEKIEIRERFIFVYFFTQTDPTRTVQRSALCRSRRELSNEYLLAKFGFDTDESETYYFEISSSREFEFELRTYEPHVFNPADFSDGGGGMP